MNKYRRIPKIGERWISALLGWEKWLTLTYMPLRDMCYHVKFGSSATKGVRINRKEPQNWRALGLRPHRVRVWLPCKNKPRPHICYRVKFDSSASNDICINRKESQKMGSAGTPPPLGWGVTDSVKTSPLPMRVTTSNLAVLSRRGGCYYGISHAPTPRGRGPSAPQFGGSFLCIQPLM